MKDFYKTVYNECVLNLLKDYNHIGLTKHILINYHRQDGLNVFIYSMGSAALKNLHTDITVNEK